jgi:hypothetical protein
LFWESEVPAISLAFDLITASGGVPVDRQGEILAVGFPSCESAIFVARRLQWAVQGFSESVDRPVSLAILIHSPEDASGRKPGGKLPAFLDDAGSGEILLTEEAAQPFENLPGFLLEAPSKGGLRRLLWRVPENHSTRSFDEEILAQLVEQHGAQSQPSQEPERAATPDVGFSEPVGTGNLAQPLSRLLRGKSRMVIGGLAAAVLLLVVVVVLSLSHGKPAPAPSQDQTQAPAASASAPVADSTPSPPAHSAATDRAETKAQIKAATNAAKAAEKASVNPPAPAAAPPAPKAVEPPPAQRGRCDLEPSQYSGQIDQAWKNLGRGKYADAQREFGAVLACDPGNGRAREGLERARMAAREAEGQN